MMSGDSVEELLRRRIGLDPATTGADLIARAARARMKAVGIDQAGAADYLALVNRSDSELQALVEEVVISESWFFRDEIPFALVADRAANGWITDPNRPPLRALSVPCARGEEAYSIAIALIDRGLPTLRFHVDAVDVSRSVIDSARLGVYTNYAFRSRDLSFRDRHFQDRTDGFALSKTVKAAVTFHQGNLLDPGLFAGRPPYDMIFCRNLMIYLDDGARERVLANLDRLLSPTGILFVGHAEQLGLLRRSFRPASDPGSFAFVRASSSSTFPIPAQASRAIPTQPPRPPTPRPTLPQARSPAPAIRPPDPPQTERPETSVKQSLEDAALLADQGRHDEAAMLCEGVLRLGGASAAPHFLLGVIRQAAGDRDRAERSFEKAVYLDPMHEDALLALSFLAQRRGDLDAAAGYRRRAERAYQEKHPR